MNFERIKKFGVVTVASGGFTGYFPVASGTFGSMVGLGLVWGTQDLSVVMHCVVALVLLAVGVWVSGEACHIYEVPDSSYIVIDEIVGMLITMIGIPVTGYWMVAGFLIFRVLDIVKLPPANIFDSHVKNGFGVMMDDVCAGIYGNILLHLMLRAQL